MRMVMCLLTFCFALSAQPQPPTIASTSPTATTTSPETFTVNARDANGYGDITRIYFLVNPTPSIPQNSCHGFFDPGTNLYYLYSDALTSISGPLLGGSAGSIWNSQCTVYGTGSGIISRAGNDVVASIRIGLTVGGGGASQLAKIYTFGQ